MGLTPMEGLVIGTRSSDVDPGIFGYLADQAGLTVDQLTDALDTASGLEGLSGAGNDMRAIQSAAADGNERACTPSTSSCTGWPRRSPRW